MAVEQNPPNFAEQNIHADHIMVIRAVIPPNSLRALRDKFKANTNAGLQLYMENLLGDTLLAKDVQVVITPTLAAQSKLNLNQGLSRL